MTLDLLNGRPGRHFRHVLCSTRFGTGEQDLRTANLRTKILDFRRSDSIIILISRGGIPRPSRDFLEILSQGILEGRFSVGRLAAEGRGRGRYNMISSI